MLIVLQWGQAKPTRDTEQVIGLLRRGSVFPNRIHGGILDKLTKPRGLDALEQLFLLGRRHSVGIG